MGRVPHPQIEIAGRAAARARLAFARHPYSAPLHRARRDADAERVRLGLARAWIGRPEREGARCPVHDLGERDQNVTLDIGAALGAGPGGGPLAEAVRSAGKFRPSGAAEKLLEKIAEPGAVEMILVRWSAVTSAPGSGGRRTVALLPACAQFIEFFPLRRVAQDLVGLVDLLEFFLGGLFVLRHVGMVFAGQLAEGLLDFLVGRLARYAERGVVVFECDGHGASMTRRFANARRIGAGQAVRIIFKAFSRAALPNVS